MVLNERKNAFTERGIIYLLRGPELAGFVQQLRQSTHDFIIGAAAFDLK
jgi:hypothetical protein